MGICEESLSVLFLLLLFLARRLMSMTGWIEAFCDLLFDSCLFFGLSHRGRR